MKDFNFFSPYLQKKRNKRQKKLFIIAASTIVIMGMLSFTALNIYHIINYKREISMVESYLSSRETNEMLSKYQNTTKRFELTDEYYAKVLEIDSFLKADNTVNTEFMDKLSSTMPKDSLMTSLSINNKEIEIVYSVKGLVPVAEIEHNLKKLDIFDRIHVNVVTKDEAYTANISGSLKDVNTIEAKTDK